MSKPEHSAIIRVIIADDHPLIRQGIRLALADEGDIRIVGEAGNGHEALKLLRHVDADVLLLDLSMPDRSAMEVIEAAQALAPTLKIMIVSAYDDAAIIQAVLHAGVVGYLLKDETEALLSNSIRTVHRGATWFSTTVMQALMPRVATPPTPTTVETLTEQEMAILHLLAQGLTNTQIAKQLHLGEQTIRNYTSRIYEKLGVGSRPEAVIWAMQNGLGTEAS